MFFLKISSTRRSVPSVLLLIWIVVAAVNCYASVCSAFQARTAPKRSFRGRLFRVPMSNNGDNNNDDANTQTISSSSLCKVVKSDDEWRQELPTEAYYVLRQAGTERPGRSPWNNVKEAGTFVCRGCGAPLFTTTTKFESGSGWPSFYQPVDGAAVDLSVDYKLILPRTEVLCATCGGHLGHVFADGPAPTGQRYCMNGVAIKFQSDEAFPELAAAVLERQTMAKKSSAQPPGIVASQIPGILLNGGIGVLFFASFVSRINDLAAMGSSPGLFDLFPILPAVYYGVLSVRGISRLL